MTELEIVNMILSSTVIKDAINHVNVLNSEMGDVKVSMAALETQMSMIIWLVKTIIAASLAFLVTQFWQVIKLNNLLKDKKDRDCKEEKDGKQ